MIEATCAACGTVNRVAESDVAVGAKFVSCTSCKARVALPTKPGGAAPGTPPATPKKVPSIPTIATKPPPTPPAAKLGAAIDLADLPAPKRTSPLAGVPEVGKPAPRPLLDDADLLAPLPKRPTSTPRPLDLDDLLPPMTPARGDAGKPKPPIADLPAPKSKLPTPAARTIDDRPAPTMPITDVDLDLPMPSVGITDLPTPKMSRGLTVDMPPPRAPAAPADISDLPTPKGPSQIVDLPTPKGRSQIVDLPTPKGPSQIVDLPTPKGPSQIVDLPTPKGPSQIVDLPTPKGPSQIVDLLTPKQHDLPAPKGFFDDLPQPSRKQGIDLPAPKGFFDDLPQPARSAGTDVAPKGFFDDLPQAAPSSSQSNELAPQYINPSDMFSGASLSEGAPATSGNRPLELDGGPELDLGLDMPTAPSPQPAPVARGALDDLDLARPSESPIKFDAPKKRPPATPMAAGGSAQLQALQKGGDVKLELEDAPSGFQKAKVAAKQQRVQETDEDRARSARRRKQVLGGALLTVALGVGGFFGYQKLYAEPKARREQVEEQLVLARRALAAPDDKHWQRAQRAAAAALALDDSNAAALGIAAEASIANALEHGVNASIQIGKGRGSITAANEAGVTGPELERAKTLLAVAQNHADTAVPKLQALVKQAPKDAFLLLYLGWAQSQIGDFKAAIATLDQAIAAGATVKLSALYARGRAKLALADLDGARADFSAVLAEQKDHIGAQVGMAAAAPPTKTQQREADLIAILARKDIATADPRAIADAWRQAGDIARLGGRLDVARERYRKALAVDDRDIGALTGLAATELRDGKLDLASDVITKALAQNDKDIDARLVQAELQIRQRKLGDASATIKELGERQPPLPPLQLAHHKLVAGRLLEAQGQDALAIDTYVDGAKLAGDFDLSPMMAAVTKLGALAKKADDARDAEAAAGFRARVRDLLSSLEGRARDDAQLSVTLGIAYLEAGDASAAEGNLARGVDMRPDDVDARLELGRARARLGKIDDALEQLRLAREKDPARFDIALEIARTLEVAGRDGEAAAAYDKLLAIADVPVAARVHAGRFFMRTGQVKKAAAQATPILVAEPENSAGHYLKGEGLLDDGKLDDARHELQLAVTGDSDNPQYLDAQGRVNEASFAATEDGKYQDGAIHAYMRAVELAPKLFNPFAGLGRIYVARQEFEKAVAPLQTAIKLHPDDPDVMFSLARTAQALQQYDAAIGWLAKSVKLKKRGEAFYLLGQLDVITNRGREALASFDEATRLGVAEEKQHGKQLPWVTDAWYRLGRAYIDLNSECAAKIPYQHFHDRNPPDGSEKRDVDRYLSTSGRGC